MNTPSSTLDTATPSASATATPSRWFRLKDTRRTGPRIDQQKLNWTLTFLVLSALPFVLYLPLWPVLLLIGACAWRWWLRRRNGTVPHALIRYSLTIVTAAVVHVTFDGFNGIEPGSSLLLVMAAMKLLESVTVRDLLVLIYMSFFMLLAGFLFDQSLITTAFSLLLVWLGVSTLIQVNRDTKPEPLEQIARKSGRMLAQALPLLLLLFILFPRIPGPFWALPSTDNTRTGLSDTMSMESISNLLQSSEIAFRVYFKDQQPSRSQLYWRGPVLEILDDNKWSQRKIQTAPSDVQLTGRPVEYTMVLEPHQSHWLLALEFPDAASLPRSTYFRNTGELISRKVVNDRLRVNLVSHPNYRFAVELDSAQRALNLDTSNTDNPRAQQLAQRWVSEVGTPGQVVNQALLHFNREPFVYSLTDVVVDKNNSVDSFLFDQRRGFCEHYASSFTLLMRYAGIPARVVTGYMGGEINGITGHTTVRQSDAHAWAEVWLKDRGWVRIDPTAAVAPERVEQGVANALPAGDLSLLMMSNSGMMTGLRQAMDAINANWNNWVLGYSDERQWSLLKKIGLQERNLSTLIVLLTVSLSVSLLLLTLWLRHRNTFRPADPAQRLYRRLATRLERLGIAFDPTEDALAYSRRVSERLPEHADAVTQFCLSYQQARYARAPSAQLLEQMRAALKQLPRRLLSRRTA